MFKNFPIEKNVPVPMRGRGEYQECAMRMEKGDSILVETNSQRTSLRSAMKSLGYRVTTRTVYSEKGKPIGARIWRTK
tara:strand:+ start:1450 stop:1683 length:234 start_codon:yes stop_codon:yes gene_type:complete